MIERDFVIWTTVSGTHGTKILKRAKEFKRKSKAITDFTSNGASNEGTFNRV